MDSKRQLGEFLQACRSRLRPADFGLVHYGERRRVPGLRREELARLAGVSTSYYARLEQGQSTGASVEVLEALAVALRLDDAERRHLHELAVGTRQRGVRGRVVTERVTPAMRDLLAAVGDVPALVLGRRSDVLAWNRVGHALFAGHVDPDSPGRPSRRPNVARLLFLDARTQALYTDWRLKAGWAVASLRSASGRWPDDESLSSLVDELKAKCAEFAVMWADHRVQEPGAATYRMRHPLVGELTVTQQVMLAERGQHLVVATTEPDSSSHEAMALLAHCVSTEPAERSVDPIRHES